MGFMYRLREALARFFYGRNGVDALGWALLIAQLALSMLSSLLGGIVGQILNYIGLVFWFLLIFRMLSKNLGKRRAENARFLRFWNPVKARMNGASARRRDTAHKYFRCRCGVYCRVPRGVGKVEITCPKCGSKIFGKS